MSLFTIIAIRADRLRAYESWQKSPLPTMIYPLPKQRGSLRKCIFRHFQLRGSLPAIEDHPNGVSCEESRVF